MFQKCVNRQEIMNISYTADHRKVYYSSGSNNDLMKLTTINLMLTCLIFEKVYCSLGNNHQFVKNDENTLCFKGK